MCVNLEILRREKIAFIDAGSWDSEATYKPTVVWNEKNEKWMLWYNGRTGNREYMGYAYRNGRDLFPEV